MESEYKLFVMHEQTSSDIAVDNLVITESVHVNHRNFTRLTMPTTNQQLDSTSKTNDNHTVELTMHNGNLANNNCSLIEQPKLLTTHKTSKLSGIITSFRHDYRKEASIAAVFMNHSEDHINNNFDSPSTPQTPGVGIMSHKGFVLGFDHGTPSPLNPNSDTILSPAEAPFGRRYAEISQFKNHPNVEW